MNRILASVACAVVLLSSGPVTAQDRSTIKVNFADLDLTKPAGIATLHRRVDQAIDAACDDPDPRDLVAVRASNACRKQAQINSSILIATAIDKAEQVATRDPNATIASR